MEHRHPPTAFDITATTDVETVPRPAWVPKVVRGEASLVADETAMKVRITGGPTLPAATDIEFSSRLRTFTVQPERPVEPGDTLYVSLARGEYEPTATLTRAPPDPETRPPVTVARRPRPVAPRSSHRQRRT